MKFRRLQLAAGCLLLVAAASIYYVRTAHPLESVGERAHRLCSHCGLEAPEVDGLIETARTTPGTREFKLELFYQTFKKREDAALCLLCSEAVLDAAEAHADHK